MSRNVSLYYGVLGQGKILVDEMSALGVKNPIWTAVWIETFSCKKAVDIYNYLTQHLRHPHKTLKKRYFLVEKNEIGVCQSRKKSLKVKDCRSLLTIYFNSDGSMQTKISVVDKKDVFIPAQCYNEFPGSEYSESDDSDDDDGFDDDLGQMEQYELRANSVIEIDSRVIV